ncbi:MAG: hypothetical protein HS111_02990 [Kofleriaceae bacterium]|nr:hypothetical protein [Kofleriaceae bacterium]MCL4222853.1 hypothetical protein [Myxococcales bacterium]
MTTIENRYDAIATRSRSRRVRDLAFAALIAVVTAVSLGSLGALGTADTSAHAAPVKAAGTCEIQPAC